MSVNKLYAALSRTGKQKILRGLSEKWSELDQEQRRNCEDTASAVLKGSRASALGKMKIEKRAEWIGRGLQAAHPANQNALLLTYFEKVRKELRDDFVGALPEEPFEEKSEAGEHARKKVDSLTAQRWPLEDVWFCAKFLEQFQTKEKEKKIITPFLHELDRRMQSLVAPKATLASEQKDAVELKDDSPEFTTLDRLVVRSVVSSLCKVEGALSFDDLDALVTELQRLNETRARSWFYRGYLDRMLKREMADWSESDNKERRSWYVAGYLLAQMRGDALRDRPKLLLKLNKQDKEALLAPNSVASAQLLPVVLRSLLDVNEVDLARQWIQSHGRYKLEPVAEIVHVWARGELLETTELGVVRSLLEAVSNLFDGEVKHGGEDELVHLGADIRRLITVTLRMEGNFSKAARHCDALLNDKTMASRKSELLVQRALIQMKVARLENFGIPEKNDKRAGFLKALEGARSLFEEASRGTAPSPVALMALALPTVANRTKGEPEQAIQHLSDAADLMVRSEEDIWQKTGLSERVDFYLALLRLEKLDVLEQTQAARLVKILKSGTRFPADLEMDAAGAASLLDTPETAELAALVLARHGYKALAKLSVKEAAHYASFRQRLADVLADAPGTNREAQPRWDAWCALLDGASKAEPQDEKMASRALDALEGLAHEFKKLEKRFLDFVSDEDGGWELIWDEHDCDEARFRFYDKHEKTELAVAVLEKMAHDAVTKQRLAEAEDLVALMTKKGAPAKQVQDMRQRLAQAAKTPDKTQDISEQAALQKMVSVFFIGGTEEDQGKYKRSLTKSLLEDHSIRVEFDLKGWNGNWGRVLSTVANNIATHDAVVLMKFIRTGLGREVRALANQHKKQWRACTGHGAASMKRAILEAARAVRGKS